MLNIKWLKLLRVHQWVKNVFIFFPLFFSGHLFNWDVCANALYLFTAFCLISSGFYVINDILDCKQDALHPRKSKRPIAAGTISAFSGAIVAVFCLFMGISLVLVMGEKFFLLALLYVFLQVLYNRYFKKIVLWDVISLAAGFLLRVWVGAQAAGVPVSFWIFMCVFVLALFLGFAKRRGELSSLKESAQQHREVLALYGVYFLDQVLLLCACMAIVFYSLYTISPEILARVRGYKLVPSVVFVMYGFLRYLYLIHMQRISADDPSELLIKDRPLLLDIFCWIVYLGWILYFS
jgi:4-hydroxybenzoate polyprenyltransferase